MEVPVDRNSWSVISLEKAELFTASWQYSNTLKAFLFHRNEIDCIRAEVMAEKVHFYLGLNDTTVEMIAVGVNSSGNDIIGNKDHSKIYNFAMPCPSTCDMRSPLYHGNIIKNNPVTFINPPDGLECIERLQEIPKEEAFRWTLAWQKAHPIKSFLYDLDQLIRAMDMTASSSIRIYFGLDTKNDDKVCSIMVGVNDNGEDDVKALLQINKNAPCSKASKFSEVCDEKSPLYHNV